MSTTFLGRIYSFELCRTCRTLYNTLGRSCALPGNGVNPYSTAPAHLKHYQRWFTSSLALNHSAPQPSTSSSVVRPLGHPWRIIAAVCVQRMPVLCKEKNQLEIEYEELSDTLRAESSKLSDFELEELEYLRKKKERERRALEEDLEGTQATKSEGADELEEIQEAREAELQEFVASSRETEADRSGDVRSVERKLDQMLYLLVKKDRVEHPWAMPQGGLEQGESLMEAAARELREECGDELEVKFLSKAPLAYHSYQHPPAGPEEIIGAKVFFFKATYEGGGLHLDTKELDDYMWATKQEMKELVSSDYFTAVAPMLLD